MNQWDEFRIERTILKIGMFLAAKRNSHLSQLGLTASQSEALLFIHDNPNSNITCLKAHLKISHQAARVLVERLKDKDLVVVNMGEKDSRSRLVSLSNQGELLHEQLVQQGQAVGAHLLEALSTEETSQLDELLDKISTSMKV